MGGKQDIQGKHQFGFRGSGRPVEVTAAAHQVPPAGKGSRPCCHSPSPPPASTESLGSFREEGRPAGAWEPAWAWALPSGVREAPQNHRREHPPSRDARVPFWLLLLLCIFLFGWLILTRWYFFTDFK